MSENTNNGMFFFINENGEFKPLVEVKSIETSMAEPQCELKCIINTSETFSATINVSEETEATLWAVSEGLEIEKGD